MATSDQKAAEDQKYAANDAAALKDEPRALAREVLAYIEPGSHLLELGCNTGADAQLFTERGITVRATDFSEMVIAQNKPAERPGLTFEVLDMAALFPYDSASFDAVYAHLSLHYYTDENTRQIFREIRRVLKPQGVLAFACKSTHDPKYGQGEEMEPDIFISHGHLRHFFSPEYAKEMLGGHYEIVRLSELTADYGDGESAFVSCIARKKD